MKGLRRFGSASIGGCVAEVFLLFVMLGLVASPGDIGGELRAWFVILLSWPVLSYVAWRGGSPRVALGRSFLFAGIFGLVAVPLLALQFPQDLSFVGGLAVAVTIVLILAFHLLRRRPTGGPLPVRDKTLTDAE